MIPEQLRSALEPVLATIASLNEQIKALDVRISELNQAYPETELLKQVSGVTDHRILTLEGKHRFNKSRDAGHGRA